MCSLGEICPTVKFCDAIQKSSFPFNNEPGTVDEIQSWWHEFLGTLSSNTDLFLILFKYPDCMLNSKNWKHLETHDIEDLYRAIDDALGNIYL